MYWVNKMIEVYKYGGNVLKNVNNRSIIYDSFKEKISEGMKIFVVVSAFGREGDSFSTDNLSKNIELLDNRDKDQIMTFGEIYSSLIIKNELLRKGIKVASVSYDEIGIICDNNYQDGNIKGIDLSYLSELIENNDVVVVPGFVGESMEGKIISLGRNTSDLTAVIIGDYFKVEKVNVVKEIAGVYKMDPSKQDNSKLMKEISYDEMLLLVEAGASIIARKTVEYAKDKGVIINICSLDEEKGTIISDVSSNENVLFIDKENDGMKVVFKDMEIFNELFMRLIDKKIKLDNLYIIKNIVYMKGELKEIDKLFYKYL